MLATPSPGDKPRFNLIFLVDVLPEESESRTGTVVSTSDATREINLVITDGGRTENFTGVLMEGYRVKMKDGSFRELKVSQIPPGTKMTVRYFEDLIVPGGKGDQVHRVFSVQFFAPSQTP